MKPEVSSKNIDSISDLVVMAPIKDGFIKAYENITYATRLKIVAEALNREGRVIGLFCCLFKKF